MRNKLEELRVLNNKLDEQINEENQPLFTDMICYIRSANISGVSQEMVRHDLTEMILSAQSRGENIKDVIGEDFKEFCDEVILNLPSKTRRKKWIERLDTLCLCISILGAINIVFSLDFINMIKNIILKQPLNYDIHVSTGMVISVILIITASVFIVDMITKNALKKENESNRVKSVLGGGAIAVALMVLFILTWKLGKQILFSINIFLAIAVIIVFFIVHKVFSQIISV